VEQKILNDMILALAIWGTTFAAMVFVVIMMFKGKIK
jgi:hypothetical protein